MPTTSKGYDTMFSDDELAEIRRKNAAKKQKEADAQAEAEAEATKERRQAARQELEARVKERFLDTGGTAGEWARMKTRLVESALIASATAPVEDEPAVPKPEVKFDRAAMRKYRD